MPDVNFSSSRAQEPRLFPSGMEGNPRGGIFSPPVDASGNHMWPQDLGGVLGRRLLIAALLFPGKASVYPHTVIPFLLFVKMGGGGHTYGCFSLQVMFVGDPQATSQCQTGFHGDRVLSPMRLELPPWGAFSHTQPLPTRLAAAPLTSCIFTQFWLTYQCVLQITNDQPFYKLRKVNAN